MPKVGLYFYVKRKILMDAVDLKDSNHYGEFEIARIRMMKSGTEQQRVDKEPCDY